jgi:hypothetical protein
VGVTVGEPAFLECADALWMQRWQPLLYKTDDPREDVDVEVAEVEEELD